jgi:membrane-bound metal-dependent hydrolase YbcI (DUF457 family)
MMNRTHRFCGGTAAFIATTAVGLPIPVVMAAIGGSVAGSSLPDDAEKLLHVDHRKLTHRPSIAYAAIAYLPAYSVYIAILAAALAFGCVMHSLLDAMTVEKHGIQLLWPFSKRGFHLLPWSWRVWVGSKSPSERLFVAIWCAFVLIYSYARFRHLILA